MTDPLTQLLRRADEAHPPPAAACATDALAARVRDRAALRKHRRTTAAVTASVAGLTACAVIALALRQPAAPLVVRRTTSHPTPAPVQEVAALTARLRELTNEADLHERIAQRLAAAAPIAASSSSEIVAVRPAARADIDPAGRQSLEAERTAALLLRGAERLVTDPAASDAARGRATAILRRVAALFPDTRGGAAARARLARDDTANPT